MNGPETAEAAEAAPPAPRFDLPGARHVVGRGLGLALVASAEIRRASLHAGLLVALLFGPPLLVVAVLADGLDPGILWDGSTDAGPIGLLAVAALVGGFGLMSLVVDAQSVCLAILGARLVSRPITFPEAVTRARQSFWRLLVSSAIVGVVSYLVSLVVASVAGGAGSSIPLDTAASIVASLATAPFIYAAAGIVLGDVGPIETLGRSVRLVRARPRIALVLVAYPVVVSAISVFAVAGAADLVVRAFQATHLEAAPLGFVIVVGGLAALFALGSLLVTIDAIVAAPQVVAFVGLTHYAAGLDRARRPDESGPATAVPRLPLVSRPMVVVLGIDWLVSILALGAG